MSRIDQEPKNTPRIRLVRTVSFSAAHRYANPALSENENQKIYGSLYREDGFGHNFLVEAHLEGHVDPLTGMIVNLVDVDRWLKKVAEKFDHRHLNELSYFDVPTPERIAESFFDLLKEEMSQGSSAKLIKIRLYEGDDLWVDCFAD